MRRPVCGECSREMTCERNGVLVAYGPHETSTARSGDRFRCGGCGSSVVVGIAEGGILVCDLTEKGRAAMLRLEARS